MGPGLHKAREVTPEPARSKAAPALFKLLLVEGALFFVCVRSGRIVERGEWGRA